MNARRERVVILGSGGREHALAWWIGRSPEVDVVVAPGNGGTVALNEPVDPMDPTAVVSLLRRLGATLLVIGPEAPLAAGVADAARAAGFPVVGPSQRASRLETSKAFAKEIMLRTGVPTAAFARFSDAVEAERFVVGAPWSDDGACVVKLDGLAGGKGVVVCDDGHAAAWAVRLLLGGAPGAELLIEERLHGPEVSVLAFVDGEGIAVLPPARDYKRVGDLDSGPNTGGMGAIAPVPGLAEGLLDDVRRRVFEPVVAEMADRGTPFSGVLYAGLLMAPDGYRVLEFNVRLGDPEAQSLLPLLADDPVDLLHRVAVGDGPSGVLATTGLSAATIVVTAPGYPGSYPTGAEILGLDSLPDGVIAFHAGTRMEDGRTVTAGGRVLALTATAETLDAAVALAYAGRAAVHFDGAHARTDIGRHA